MDKKILFLGAGASYPYFDGKLSSGTLTETIRNPGKWKNLIDRYSRIMRGTNIVYFKDIMNLIYEISSDTNFEEIIECIDKVSSYHNSANPMHNMLNKVLRVLHTPLPSSPTIWMNVPFLSRQLIAEEVKIIQDNNKSTEYNRLIAKQKEFIEYLSIDSGVNIVSLNYDEVVYDSTEKLKFDNGFIHGRFVTNSFLGAKNVLSFPHGHIRFGSYNSDILYEENSNESNARRLVNLNRSNAMQTTTVLPNTYNYIFNTFLVTGQQKDTTFDLNPYQAYYQRFIADVFDAKEIYVVGYSFSDPHFNRFLLNFLNRNPKNKVLLIDFVSEDINIHDDIMVTDSLIQKIWLTFNKPVVVFHQTVGATTPPIYDLQANIDSLNKTGFGMMLPQVYLYKNGYQSFLEQFGTILPKF